jgi:serine protease AprX
MFRKTFYNWLIASSVLVLLTTIASADINDQVAQLDIDNANLDDVIRIFGEPVEFSWGAQIYERDDLPVKDYCVCYPNMFCIHMRFDWVMELRFHSPATDYVWTGGIRIGSSLNDVLNVLPPLRTVVGQSFGEQEGVLYKDINGIKGYCYYHRTEQNVRFFFTDYKVSCLYVTRSDFNTFQPPEAITPPDVITSIEPYDDVRWKDMSQVDLSDRPNLPATLWFNQDTIWPDPNNMPPGCDLNQILTAAMNPCLGVRQFHQQGITGKGVNVAIIDQAMYLNHPEFAGKIAAYYDVAGGEQSSMHGPAVTSLLVGTNCGTAPDANVYYAACRSGVHEVDYVEALNWIVDQGQALPAQDKIRVVSVSAAPGVAGTPSEQNQEGWELARARAEQAGILVLDCTPSFCLIGRCWYDSNDPENVTKCTPGAPGMEPWIDPGKILTPASPRTTAEQYYSDIFSYQYCGRGGLSWSIPYCAGVLAMGWQVQPELTKEQMVDLLFQTAYLNPDGAQIINPPAFIDLLLENKPAIQLSNDAFEFYADFNGPNPETQILSISNSGLGTLNWVIEETCGWLQVSPDSGVSTGVNDINEITLSITEINLGVHTCELTISDPCAINNPQFVSITLYVSDPNAQTIQDAIDAAEDGDIVIIDPGIYTGEGNRDLDFKGKAITLRSIDPDDPDVVATTVINCQGSESEPHHGFYFHTNEDASSVLAGFTITGGYEWLGGAIYCINSSPTIRNCVLVDNSADLGGGMHNTNCSPVVTNCTFINNSAALFGGGIRNHTSSPRLDNCLLTGNSAQYGGGMQNENSSSNPTLINCTFSGNSASSWGGGMINFGDLMLTNCILWNNRDGGGVGESAQILMRSGIPAVNYSCIQGWTGGFGGIGNTGTNPLFADPEIGDYHLKSEVGRWNPESESWVVDDVTSPCIDAGAPNYPVSGEPEPNGGRINMGAYGGTNEASKSPTN